MYNIFKWLFRPTKCKFGTHDYIDEVVINDDRTVTKRLQCLNCPVHTTGWTFPRQAKIARFR